MFCYFKRIQLCNESPTLTRRELPSCIQDGGELVHG